MRRKKKARWEFIHGRGGRLASLPPYPRPIAKEIEEMYEYGAPHCLYHPDDPLLCDTGATSQMQSIASWLAWRRHHTCARTASYSI